MNSFAMATNRSLKQFGHFTAAIPFFQAQIWPATGFLIFAQLKTQSPRLDLGIQMVH
jgi:hypothetical protein